MIIILLTFLVLALTIQVCPIYAFQIRAQSYPKPASVKICPSPIHSPKYFVNPTLKKNWSPKLYCQSQNNETRDLSAFPNSRAADLKSKLTLTSQTMWRIFLTLQLDGKTKTRTSVVVRFVEERNYEPPQGRVYIEADETGFVKSDGKGYSGVWTLSEDKEDRKDGLWVWGLFEEPKYPFLYFYLDVYDTLMLETGEVVNALGEGGGIPNGRLNFRFSHSRDKVTGAVVKDGLVTFKVTELMKADPLGLGGLVDVGDSVSAGLVEIRPEFVQ